MTEELEARLSGYRERGASRVKLGLTDVDGVLRGKYVSLDKFASVMEKGGGFCDCVFGWDVDDVLYEGEGADSAATGWHTGFPDARYRLDAASERWLPNENLPFFLGEFIDENDAPHALCPRSRLGVLLERLAGAGLSLMSGYEYEFFVFEETPHSLREKGYRGLRPLTPGNFGYSVLRASQAAEHFNGLMDRAESLGTPLEGLHCETGPGVWEGALAACAGIESADRAQVFKTFAKSFFHEHDLSATFMAKWSMDYPGQSGHYHFSLLDAAGTNVFHDPEDANGLSETQRWVLGGLQQHLPELLALLAPTINSYTRLVQGAWAPTAATWGVENRTCALRVIAGGPGSQRIECRVPGADANPYLVGCAVLTAALDGIENRLQPDDPVRGNAYDVQASLPGSRQFPAQLRGAAERLSQSDVARRFLGDAFVDHFVMSRLWESQVYEQTVNTWQLERYFEII